VALAVRLIDESEVRGYKLHVEEAHFELKGQYDATKKKKKNKDYRKRLQQQQKYCRNFPVFSLPSKMSFLPPFGASPTFSFRSHLRTPFITINDSVECLCQRPALHIMCVVVSRIVLRGKTKSQTV